MAWLVVFQEEVLVGSQCSLVLGIGTSYFLPGCSALRRSIPLLTLLHLNISGAAFPEQTGP